MKRMNLKLQFIDVWSQEELLSYVNKANKKIAFLEYDFVKRLVKPIRYVAVYIRKENTVYVLQIRFMHLMDSINQHVFVCDEEYDWYSLHLSNYRMMVKAFRWDKELYQLLLEEQQHIAEGLLEIMV